MRRVLDKVETLKSRVCDGATVNCAEFQCSSFSKVEQVIEDMSRCYRQLHFLCCIENYNFPSELIPNLGVEMCK